AFFYIEIIISFSSLFSFVPQKSAALLMIFVDGATTFTDVCSQMQRHELTTSASGTFLLNGESPGENF
ncbi:hypothetical protein, partial [Aneurinibacillus danicus]|uniref:hypothetical protein n=1 Tax=Aneurinibacillus danicus TaxID=267746 RepID=UPI001C3FC5E0